jgi:hypothetical protein
MPLPGQASMARIGTKEDWRCVDVHLDNFRKLQVYLVNDAMWLRKLLRVLVVGFSQLPE